MSLEVSGGVNGHECRTWGYTSSPTPALVFAGCLRSGSSQSASEREAARLLQHVNWKRKQLSALGEITTLLESKHKCDVKEDLWDGWQGRHVEGLSLPDDCRGCCWFPAWLAEG